MKSKTMKLFSGYVQFSLHPSQPGRNRNIARKLWVKWSEGGENQLHALLSWVWENEVATI